MTTVQGDPTCVFCGSSGPLTKEHVIRDKFNVIFGADRVSLTETHLVGNYLGELESERQFTYLGQRFGKSVRSVCAECNNGWMNELENDVEADLLELFHNRPIAFTLEERARLARWVAKTALVRQLTDAKEVRIDADHLYREVMGGASPMWSWVFAAPLERTDTPRTRSTQTFIQMGVGQPFHRVLISTLHIERLLLVSVYAEDEEIGRWMDHRFQVLEVPVLVPISPSVRKIDWGSLEVQPAELFYACAEIYLEILRQTDPPPLPPLLPLSEQQRE